jgi:hypothetical protein
MEADSGDLETNHEVRERKTFPETARAIPELGFDTRDQDRMDMLSRKAREGILSADERTELETYLRVNDLLTILQSKARQSL